METVAREAADFQALLARVRELRKAAPDGRSVVTVTAENSGAAGGLARNSLLVPVVGIVSSVILLGEKLSLFEVIGSAVIFCGLLINVFVARLGRPAPAAP